MAHIGWNEKKMEISEVDEGKLKQIFDEAQISQQQLDDRETREFIYGFIQSYNNIPKTENVQQSNSAQQPPPVPSRAQGMPRMAPAPPSVNMQKRPPAELPMPREPPSRPPPIKMESTPQPDKQTNIPAPPPMPPPMPSLAQMQSTAMPSQPFNK